MHDERPSAPPWRQRTDARRRRLLRAYRGLVLNHLVLRISSNIFADVEAGHHS